MTDYRFQRAPYPQPTGMQSPRGGRPASRQTIVEAGLVEQRFIVKVYGWMTLALVITGAVAFLLRDSAASLAPYTLWIFLGQIGLVLAISFGLQRMRAGTATALFVIYAITMGVTLAVIFAAYDLGTIWSAFLASAGMFAAMAVIGWVTKRDLTKFGMFLFMALIGVVIASIVGIFVASSIITFIWLYVGLLVFLGLTVYETWLIKKTAADATAAGAEVERKFSIIFALALYLNFINIFIRLLAIIGGR